MRYGKLSLAVLFVVTASQGQAQVVQSQLSSPAYMANFSQTDLAQSFEQAHNNISGARRSASPVNLFPRRRPFPCMTICQMRGVPC